MCVYFSSVIFLVVEECRVRRLDSKVGTDVYLVTHETIFVACIDYYIRYESV